MQFRFLKLCVFFALSICAASAGAAIIVVDTLADEDNTDGDCSLREAVAAANDDAPRDDCTSGSGGDLIFLNVTGTINLTSPLYITERVELLGTGMDSLTISGQNSTIHFVVAMPNDNHDLKIEDVTLANGFASSNGGSMRILDGGLFKLLNVRFANNHATGAESASGGAIEVNIPLANDSTLDIEECIFENNSANRNGGALHTTDASTAFPTDTIKITRSVFTNNSANADGLNAGWGGAVYMKGVDSVTVIDSLFEDNQASTGGALHWSTHFGSTAFMTINGSSFIDNLAGAGGALNILFATTLIQNSTFSGNDSHPFNEGDAIMLNEDGLLAIFFTTFHNNGRGSNGDNSLNACNGCIVTLNHSIVWTDFESSENCRSDAGASFQSQGFNIDRDGSCTSDPSDLPMTNPGLHPLDDHGDGAAFVTLPTLLPEEGGAALDGGATDSCPGPFSANTTDDQRDEPRPVAGPAGGAVRCDIGAVEHQSGSEPEFAPVEVVVDGPDGNIVNAAPGALECPEQCVEEYQIGATVTLSVSRLNVDSEFTGWSGGGCTGTGDCELTITGPVTVTATFEQVQHRLDVFVNGNGQVTSTPTGIDCPGTCGAYFDTGSNVNLTATADSGSSFQNWSGDCSGQSNTCELTMDDSRSATAVFDLVDEIFGDRFETP